MPFADCTSENDTAQVWSVSDSASASSGTLRTFSPRTANGNTMEVKSPSTQTISAPSGAAAATTDVMVEVCVA